MSYLSDVLATAVDRDRTLCWPWPGRPNSSGYGSVSWRVNGRTTSTTAHRAVYEALIEPIPGGLQIDHLCRNTMCVNPAHMEVVTGRVNILRGGGVGAENARRIECRRGHPFDETNTLVSAGRRVCRECKRESDRRFKARRKANGVPA